MIQRISIANFQSHKETVLDLAPGVNVIVGATDSGKSAILRALRWLIWNRPSGDAFRSTWGGDTEVHILLEGGSYDGYYVKRNKGDNKNEYHKWYINGTGSHRVLKAFGNDVPQDIQEILNMDETNFQKQLDAPFLISNSSGEVASYFNKVAHLEKIDSSNQYVQSQIRSLTSKIQSDEERLEQTKPALEQFDYLEQTEIDLVQLEEKNEKYNLLERQVVQLQSNILNLMNLESLIAENEKLLVLEEEVMDIYAMIRYSKTLKDSREDLQDSLQLLESYNSQLEYFTDTIKYEDLVLSSLNKYSSLKKLVNREEELLKLVNSYEQIEKKIGDLTKEMKTMEEDFHNYIGETCPLCGSNLSNSK